MNFYNIISSYSKHIDIFFDMDGIIASYDFGKLLDFKNKRPLTSNIDIIRKVSLLDNVLIHILSVCRKNYQIDEKNAWLDKYATFFL